MDFSDGAQQGVKKPPNVCHLGANTAHGTDAQSLNGSGSGAQLASSIENRVPCSGFDASQNAPVVIRFNDLRGEQIHDYLENQNYSERQPLSQPQSTVSYEPSYPSNAMLSSGLQNTTEISPFFSSLSVIRHTDQIEVSGLPPSQVPIDAQSVIQEEWDVPGPFMYSCQEAIPQTPLSSASTGISPLNPLFYSNFNVALAGPLSSYGQNMYNNMSTTFFQQSDITGWESCPTMGESRNNSNGFTPDFSTPTHGAVYANETSSQNGVEHKLYNGVESQGCPETQAYSIMALKDKACFNSENKQSNELTPLKNTSFTPTSENIPFQRISDNYQNTTQSGCNAVQFDVSQPGLSSRITPTADAKLPQFSRLYLNPVQYEQNRSHDQSGYSRMPAYNSQSRSDTIVPPSQLESHAIQNAQPGTNDGDMNNALRTYTMVSPSTCSYITQFNASPLMYQHSADVSSGLSDDCSFDHYVTAGTFGSSTIQEKQRGVPNVITTTKLSRSLKAKQTTPKCVSKGVSKKKTNSATSAIPQPQTISVKKGRKKQVRTIIDAPTVMPTHLDLSVGPSNAPVKQLPQTKKRTRRNKKITEKMETSETIPFPECLSIPSGPGPSSDIKLKDDNAFKTSEDWQSPPAKIRLPRNSKSGSKKRVKSGLSEVSAEVDTNKDIIREIMMQSSFLVIERSNSDFMSLANASTTSKEVANHSFTSDAGNVASQSATNSKCFKNTTSQKLPKTNRRSQKIKKLTVDPVESNENSPNLNLKQTVNKRKPKASKTVLKSISADELEKVFTSVVNKFSVDENIKLIKKESGCPAIKKNTVLQETGVQRNESDWENQLVHSEVDDCIAVLQESFKPQGDFSQPLHDDHFNMAHINDSDESINAAIPTTPDPRNDIILKNVSSDTALRITIQSSFKGRITLSSEKCSECEQNPNLLDLPKEISVDFNMRGGPLALLEPAEKVNADVGIAPDTVTPYNNPPTHNIMDVNDDMKPVDGDHEDAYISLEKLTGSEYVLQKTLSAYDGDGEKATYDDGYQAASEVNEKATGNEDEIATGNEGEIATGNEDEKATGNEDEIATGNEGEIATGNEDEKATGNEDEKATGNEDEIATGNEDEKATGNEDEIATGNEDEKATGNEDEIATGNEDEKATGNEDKKATGNEDEIATGNEEEKATGKENEKATNDYDEEETNDYDEEETNDDDEEATYDDDNEEKVTYDIEEKTSHEYCWSQGLLKDTHVQLNDGTNEDKFPFVNTNENRIELENVDQQSLKTLSHHINTANTLMISNHNDVDGTEEMEASSGDLHENGIIEKVDPTELYQIMKLKDDFIKHPKSASECGYAEMGAALVETNDSRKANRTQLRQGKKTPTKRDNFKRRVSTQSDDEGNIRRTTRSRSLLLQQQFGSVISLPMLNCSIAQEGLTCDGIFEPYEIETEDVNCANQSEEIYPEQEQKVFSHPAIFSASVDNQLVMPETESAPIELDVTDDMNLQTHDVENPVVPLIDQLQNEASLHLPSEVEGDQKVDAKVYRLKKPFTGTQKHRKRLQKVIRSSKKKSDHMAGTTELGQIKKEESVDTCVLDSTTSKSSEEVEVKLAKKFRPPYTNDEKARLYADKLFVMDLQDSDADPEDIFIWQINESELCLRQFYPAKFCEFQFHMSSPVRWYFMPEDFRGEVFCDRFQPIPVVVAKEDVIFPESSYKKQMVETIVQYVYIDRMFFMRVCKHIGQIYKTEHLKDDFMQSLMIYNFIALDQSFMANMSTTSYDENTMEKLDKHTQAWDRVGTRILEVLAVAEACCDFNELTLQYMKMFPHLTYSSKTVNKSVFCRACFPKNRTPLVKVTFMGKASNAKPYNHKTLEHEQTQHTIPEATYWCRACSLAARKFHRLHHFRYNLMSLIKQNFAKDANLFLKKKIPVTDRIVIWLQSIDVNWRNQMFLDFQICMAEVVSEFRSNNNTQTA